jgi:hypothetical protein
MVIARCGCGKCRKESDHGLGFVWERKAGPWKGGRPGRWFKRYSIKPR